MAGLFKRRQTGSEPIGQAPELAVAPSVHEILTGHEVPAEASGMADGIEGYIDLVDGERVVGWAYDARSPGRRLLIEISAADTVEVVLANLERNDLRDAGKGDGRHGFEARLDLASIGADAVHVKVAEADVHLGGSPASTDLMQLIAKADGGTILECLRSEAQVALMSLKGLKKR